MNTSKKTGWLVAVLATITLAACGGGSASSTDIGWDASPDWSISPNNPSTPTVTVPATGDNVVPVQVNSSMGNINTLFVSIKVCIPGKRNPTQCVTVDNMLVDTGSTGVRIGAWAIPSLAPLLLTQAGATDDKLGTSPIAQCMPFASGYTWGAIKRADILIGKKTADNLPIQVIADGAYATPADCVSYGGADLGSVAAMGANGIVGIDNFTGDSLDALTTAVPGLYYYCLSRNNCISTRMEESKEVTNPVFMFTSDNNGTVIRLPALPAGGRASVDGQLVFGVSTQQNNMLPANATVLAVDKYGTFTTQYQGRVMNRSAIDSGTNGYGFQDETIPTAGAFPYSWYIPSSKLNLYATMEATDGTGTPLAVPFSIENARVLAATGYAAFDTIGAYFASSNNNMFLWGLPFFYGRDVYTVISYAKIGQRTGPFVAF
ncbi:hypothetical protein ABH945_002847 [Paraburkholderia sp. GAS333]|uniref:DUF3443 domain-containing protein n=1 Tax=Paraburkholderia sp. GAS333 TaxID=3156279 RepID=UPI003D220290